VRRFGKRPRRRCRLDEMICGAVACVTAGVTIGTEPDDTGRDRTDDPGYSGDRLCGGATRAVRFARIVARFCGSWT
jgi:hypothetical protein